MHFRAWTPHTDRRDARRAGIGRSISRELVEDILEEHTEQTESDRQSEEHKAQHFARLSFNTLVCGELHSLARYPLEGKKEAEHGRDIGCEGHGRDGTKFRQADGLALIRPPPLSVGSG